ncbi:MAG: hypothetical protein NZ772_02745 [Cyanobacteria bacterium]|nr:hypothetical protein [Cyanobacteriota bacterium]MDW8200408.1 hypothetical protein [Cyanobacteriota bacterium SKYGB_h_bin112]
MSCPTAAYGQRVCQIVDHPDRRDESFCATCQRRFVQPRSEGQMSPSQGSNGLGFLSTFGGVCLALLLVSIIARQPDLEPDSPQEPQPLATITSSASR